MMSMKSMGGSQDDWGSVDDDHQTFIVLAPGTTKEDMENRSLKSTPPIRIKNLVNHVIICCRNFATFIMIPFRKL